MSEPPAGNPEPEANCDDASSTDISNTLNSMRISLTDRALKEAQHLAATEAHYRGLSLRVYVEGKGCDGFYYGVAFADRLAGDLSFTQDTIEIVIDQESHTFMAGSVIDWVDDERGRGFLVDNPNHRRFRGKFFKRKSWQERLGRHEPAASPDKAQDPTYS